MLIRPYIDNTDRQKVIELLQLNTPEYFAPEEEEDLIYYFDNHADNYFVVDINGQVVGCGGFNLTDDKLTGKISWDIIHPNYQRMGIGKQLLDYRINEISKIASVKFVSVRTSQHVYAFYEKAGLKLNEVVKDYWAKEFDLYTLSCGIDKIIEDKTTNN